MPDLADELLAFDAELPIERANTPPASWYRDESLAALERDAVFGNDWIAVALAQELATPGDQLAVEVCGWPILVLRGADGELAAFHNACRHHGTLLVAECAHAQQIRCGYHGWTYGLDGALRTAPRMGGVRDFDPARHGLVRLGCRELLGLVFVHLDLQRDLGRGAGPASEPGVASPAAGPARELLDLQARLEALGTGELRFAARRRYRLHCNWKVFVDNYLDGGYHVAALHPGLAALLDLDSYRTEVSGRVSIQSCAGRGQRVGGEALYAFVHPNLMLNRYGDMLDVNRVLPIDAQTCEVIIDWAFRPGLGADERLACLAQSDQVQQEDLAICEAVQRGMASPGYGRGVYAPRLEGGAHAFHRELARQLRAGLAGRVPQA